MTSRHPLTEAIERYKEQNPDVDWSQNLVTVVRVQANYVAIGHRLKNPEIEAIMDRCCCHPGKPRGHCD